MSEFFLRFKVIQAVPIKSSQNSTFQFTVVEPHDTRATYSVIDETVKAKGERLICHFASQCELE